MYLLVCRWLVIRMISHYLFHTVRCRKKIPVQPLDINNGPHDNHERQKLILAGPLAK